MSILLLTANCDIFVTIMLSPDIFMRCRTRCSVTTMLQ